MARELETDLLIIGSGITAALMAARLAETTQRQVLVVEAGTHSTPFADRARRRARWLAYGESPWVADHLDDQNAVGTPWGYSPTMMVGGLAMHWGGVAPRYSPEDFRLRSLYGVGDDWPIDYDALDPFYQEAEERMGIAGEQGPAPFDPRGRPYPLPPLPLDVNLQAFQKWAAKSDIPTWSTPSAKNSVAYGGRAQCQRCDSCYPVCPSGAKYTPDWTWDRLRASGRVRLETGVLIRRLEADPATARLTHATGNRTTADGEAVRIGFRDVVLAGGYVWTPHLLLLSHSARYPGGLANRSGLVGAWLCGHRNVAAQVSLPMRAWPGINVQHSLVSRKFMHAPGRIEGRYLRHDLRIWESTVGREPRLRGDDGALLLGDALLDDWRARARGATARVRAYYDVLPARESALTLDATARNRFGDPLPRVRFVDSAESAAWRPWQEARLQALFESMARAGDGEVISRASSANDLGQEHPGGGCRMGRDPATSVVDPTGRSHDHENLWIAGAPTHVSASCCNGTLTFVAVGLRTAAAIAGALPAGGPAAPPVSGAGSSPPSPPRR